jgi:predicted MFS family arabinose efflux permease
LNPPPPASSPQSSAEELRTQLPARGIAGKALTLGSLYLAQGLPFGFFTLALPVMLRDAGYSLKAISVLSLLQLPWALKFLWAAWLDQRGTAKTWLLGLQLSSVIGAVLLMQVGLDKGYTPVLIAAFAFNLIAASQDVITDGLAVRTLDGHERGLGNGLQVGAYRIGMMLGGGLLLRVFAHTNWATTFACMAIILALTIVPVMPLRAPRHVVGEAPTAAQLATRWAQRLRAPGVLRFIGLIFCYRFGDQVISSLFPPFLRDAGLGLQSIALMKGEVGNATSLLGAVIGGWFVFNTSRRNALLTSGLAQAAVFCLYIVAAFGIGGTPLLWAATISEGVISTMATVALFTLMMDASEMQHAGTDYTVFASAVVGVGALGSFAGGAIGDAFGYATAFIVGTALAALGCVALVWLLDRNPAPQKVAEVWRARRDGVTRDEVTT